MLKIYEYESKTEEENIEQFLSSNELTKEDMIIISNEESGSLFKAKKVKSKFTSKKDIFNYIKEYFKEMTSLMNINASVEIRESDSIYNVQLISDNNSILIGKEGKTIAAMQNMIRLSLETLINQKIKINLDVANYKNNKLKKIEREIKKIAKEVLSSKVDVSLDPMNSYERRYVHCLISEYENLETESIGEGIERHIVIKYIGE